jgi:predicted ATPase/transcriptional regulator with XRE-family HTH domain
MDTDESFGPWLKRRRKALDLTQADLARRVGCAVVTIRKIEAEQQRPSRQIAARLAEHLAIESDDRPAFVAFARGELDAGPPPLPRSPARLPAEIPPNASPPALPVPLSPLIGREHEVAEVVRLLGRADVRLLTLLGPGGIGKTRVALQVAARLTAAFTGGACFVDLSPLQDPALVASAIGRALGIREVGAGSMVGRLAYHLRDRQILLVLDNFEHLVDAAPLITNLLAGAPGLKVLVTSRAVLHLSPEYTFPVPPLALPASDAQPSLEDLSRYAAVELFVQRARAVQPDFAVTAVTLPLVLAICRQLEGLPLAIELAAARITALSPQEMLVRLSNRLALLTGGARNVPARQRTIRSTIAWSYDLLEPDQRRLFRRLAIFVGGCTLESAEAVAAGEPLGPTHFDHAAGDTRIQQDSFGTLEAIERLIEQSLLRRETGRDGASRYTMLETIRAYALEQLVAYGEEAAMEQRFAEYELALAEAAAPKLAGAEQRVWFDLLEAELDNLRAVLAWSQSASGDVAIGLRLVWAIADFWWVRGHVSEGRAWLDRLLEQSASHPTPLRARALSLAGILAWLQNDWETVRRLIPEALRLAHAQEDPIAIFWATYGQGLDTQTRADFGAAATCFEACIRLAQDMQDEPACAWAIHGLGDTHFFQGDLACAAALFAESQARFRQLGDDVRLGHALLSSGAVALRQGDFAQAATALEESLARFRNVGHLYGLGWTLCHLGDVALASGDSERAAGWFEEALQLYRDQGIPDGVSTALFGLGRAMHQLNDDGRAAHLLWQSLEAYDEGRDIGGITRRLEVLAGLMGSGRQAEHAVQLLGIAEILRVAHGIPLAPAEVQEVAQARALLHARLGEAAFAAAIAKGRTMTLHEVLDTMRRDATMC